MSDAGARAPVDAALVEKWALAYLARYSTSAEHLRRVLERRVRRRIGPDRAGLAAAGGLIAELVARYRTAGLLDDAAYAAARARRLLTRGTPPRRIAAGLAAHGVASDDAAAALAILHDAAGDLELTAAGVFARRRRLGPFRTGPADAATRARELAAFARSGFARETARRVLACRDPEALAALLATDRCRTIR